MKYTRQQEFLSQFGKRVRELRQQKGFSQEELANYADLELSQINRIELGKINTSISHVKVIADALGVEPKVLFEVAG